MTRRGLALLALPAIWTLLFVAVPLGLIFKISFAEPLLAQPPYSALFQPGEYGPVLKAHFDNYALIVSDPLYLRALGNRSEEHTSELQSLMRISYAVFCLKK